jgi:hypothetical protein
MPVGRTSNPLALLAFSALLVVLIFGSTLRYQAFAQSKVPLYPHGDAAKYFLYAYNLSNFGIYGYGELKVLPADTDKAIAQEVIKPDAINTPGYPLYLSLFLGGTYTEEQRDRALFGQVLLSSLTILLAYAAFSPIGRIYGIGVATLTALSPHLINQNLFLLTETLFCFLLMVFVWVISRMDAKSRLPWFFFAGLLLTMATMTRPWIQAYLFVYSGYLFLSKLRFSSRQIIFVLIGAAITASPWLIRNSLSLGIAADGGQLVRSIHHGMYPNMKYEEQNESLGYAYNFDPMSSELGESLGVTVGEIARRAKAEPFKYAQWYLAGKIQSVLSWKIIAGADAIFVYHVGDSPYFELPRFYLSAYYMEKSHPVLMFLALIGTLIVWLPMRPQRQLAEQVFFLRAVSLLVLYFLALHMIVAPYPRYSIPMRPILYAMALYPIYLMIQVSGLWDFLTRRGSVQKGNRIAATD